MRKLGYLLSVFIGAGLASTSWADTLGDEKRFDDSNGGWGLNPEVLATLQEQGFAPTEAAGSPCVDGRAMGILPCRNIDMLSFVPNASMNVVRLNDVWGWTDTSGREFALVGATDGTSFVEVTDPLNPRFLGKLPSHQRTDTGAPRASTWRDIKVFADHAFIGADSQPMHGMQVFDLRQLLTIDTPVEFTETAHLPFGSSHNMAINEETGYAYAVGTARDVMRGDCGGGLLMIDISNPAAPRRIGCYEGDGYTHDAQCVVYRGPDVEHQNKEICFAYNEDTLTLVDVTNKATPVQLSRTPYFGFGYTHQGWLLNENQDTLIMDDEGDERGSRRVRTTSYIFDVSDLDNPRELGRYVSTSTAIDHNLYTFPNPVGGRDLVIEANYRSGVRILNTVGIREGRMQEGAFFDVIPENDAAQFSGTWTAYPYFPSGNVVATDIGNGLYVLRPNYAAIEREASLTRQPVTCGGGDGTDDGSTCPKSEY